MITCVVLAILMIFASFNASIERHIVCKPEPGYDFDYYYRDWEEDDGCPFTWVGSCLNVITKAKQIIVVLPSAADPKMWENIFLLSVTTNGSYS